MLRRTIYGVLLIAAFVLGAYVGASEYRGALDGIKWTDVAALLITFTGLCLALYTYQSWIRNKKRDDSYLAAKQYLAMFSQICGSLDELSRQYESMCPAPGVIVYSKHSYQRKIEHVIHVREGLYQHKSKLLDSLGELSFWGVRLKDEFMEKHLEFISALNNTIVISDALNSQLHGLHLQDGNNISEVSREKKMFDKQHNIVAHINEFRINNGFLRVFLFNAAKES